MSVLTDSCLANLESTDASDRPTVFNQTAVSLAEARGLRPAPQQPRVTPQLLQRPLPAHRMGRQNRGAENPSDRPLLVHRANVLKRLLSARQSTAAALLRIKHGFI